MMLIITCHCVRTVERRRRPVQDLHLTCLVEGEILRHGDLAAGRMIDAHTIEHDQQLVVAVVALHAEVVESRRLRAAHEVHARQVFEQVGKVAVAALANLRARDHHDVRRRVIARLASPRGGHHRRIDQLFERKREQADDRRFDCERRRARDERTGKCRSEPGKSGIGA